MTFKKVTFKTQYDPRERVHVCPGDPIKKLFTGSYNEFGQVELKETGQENLYEYIQSFADSTDIHTIMRRFVNGEVDVLEKVQGFYGDVTEMPRTYAEALQRISDSEKVFNSLPVDVRSKFGHSFAQFLSSVNDADFLEKLGVSVDANDVKKPDVVADVKDGVVSES